MNTWQIFHNYGYLTVLTLCSHISYSLPAHQPVYMYPRNISSVGEFYFAHISSVNLPPGGARPFFSLLPTPALITQVKLWRGNQEWHRAWWYIPLLMKKLLIGNVQCFDWQPGHHLHHFSIEMFDSLRTRNVTTLFFSFSHSNPPSTFYEAYLVCGWDFYWK